MGLFREMADIRAGAEKAQDKPGTFHKLELKENSKNIGDVKRKQKPAQRDSH